MSKTILEVKEIKKVFGKNTAVNNISFQVAEGDIYGIIGPNGAGKTTMIRIILGLLKPDKGKVIINNYCISKEFYSAIANVGALIEGPAFYDYLSAYDNLKIFQAYSGKVNKEKIKEILELVGLGERSKDIVKTFSLGMKQRLGIAQALLNNPKLLILDEPTNGLDPIGIKEFRQLLRYLSSNNITIIISSHILPELENVCNKILVVNKGKKIVSGATKTLINQSNQYEINSSDNNVLLEELKTNQHIEINSIDEDKLIVKFDNKLLPGDLLTEIVYKGIKINKYAPVKFTLEDLFFNLTGRE